MHRRGPSPKPVSLGGGWKSAVVGWLVTSARMEEVLVSRLWQPDRFGQGGMLQHA